MDLAALCLNYLGIARVELGDPGGLELVRDEHRRSPRRAATTRRPRAATRNLAELLLRAGRLDELERCVAEGLAFTRERGFWSHAYNLEVHRCLRCAPRRLGRRRGGPARARRRASTTPGCSTPTACPWLGRLLARRGDPAAGGLLAAAWEQAQRLGCCSAWPTPASRTSSGRGWPASPAIAARGRGAPAAAPRAPGRGGVPGELLRYLAPRRAAGGAFDRLPADRAPGCAATARGRGGLAGAGDPYETALALARVRRRRGGAAGAATSWTPRRAAPAAARVRARLRAAGAHRSRAGRGAPRAQPGRPDPPPARGPRARSPRASRTPRSRERLVLSVRTVDHHVAAVLDKLGVRRGARPRRGAEAGVGA